MRVFILGAGKSGTAAARLAKDLGAGVFLYDDNMQITNYKLQITNSDLVVVSPGVPSENEVYSYAKTSGKIIKSELEFAFDVCKAPVIAITGTNGKTTTTVLIAHLLSMGGLSVTAGGNLGLPFSDFARGLQSHEIAVLEVSSFMLETALSFRPRVAVLLNITPDHLDRHKNIEEYTAAKMKIFQNQTEEDYAVLNSDDPIIVENADKIKAKKIWFSSKNTLAAMAAAKIFGIPDADIERGLSTFKALPHRLELVAEAENIKFFNDSKATNIAAALNGAGEMKGDTVMILGGSDKGYEYDGLFEKLPQHIVHCIFIGAVSDKLAKAAERTGYKKYSKCDSLEEAVCRGRRFIDPRPANILLSPAAASFDMYKNFEERGDAFKEIVKKHAEKE